jgi:hypothetical protein
MDFVDFMDLMDLMDFVLCPLSLMDLSFVHERIMAVQ